MNPDDDEIASDQFLKQPKTSKVNGNFLNSFEDRRLGGPKKNDTNHSYNLQAFAEDELVRKEYKEMRCDMPGMPRSTFLMVFSPDGSKVASTHGNHNIYVTDIRSGKNIKTLIGHPRTPWCIAFHPTSNQIVASGCLGGQVRIWDLSGGSEVWTTDNQSVIASIAFHPNDRVLVIATYNEVYFWDWSKPEPFTHTATSNPKEKVRYVAFDKLGHKLVTGIANSPQTRWERVRAPVPVPRQAERSASPYRRRITPRLVSNLPQTFTTQASPNNNNREPLSSVPERERRITACYRNLVHEYEMLVHRYLQVYRQPTMVDRGTDPMESTSSNNETQTPHPSTSNAVSSELPSVDPEPQPSTSAHTEDLNSVTTSNPVPPSSSPSMIIPSSFRPLKRKPRTWIRGTQTSEHTDETDPIVGSSCTSQDVSYPPSGSSANAPTGSSSSSPLESSDNTNTNSLTHKTSQTQSTRRLLVISTAGNEINMSSSLPSTSGIQTPEKSAFKMRIKCSPRRRSSSFSSGLQSLNEKLDELRQRLNIAKRNRSQASTSGLQNNSRNSLDGNNQGTSTSTRQTNEGQPSSSTGSLSHDRVAMMRRLLYNDRVHFRARLKRVYPMFNKKDRRAMARRPLESSSDSSSSGDDGDNSESLSSRHAKKFIYKRSNSPTSTVNKSLPTTPSNLQSATNIESPGNSATVNYNTELEHLVTDLLTDSGSSQNSSGSRENNVENTSVNNNSAFDRFSSSLRNVIINTLNTQADSNNDSGISSNVNNDSTSAEPCARTIVNTNTRTTNSTIYTSSHQPRRRICSYRMSAFLPTHAHHPPRPHPRLRRSQTFSSARLRSHIGNLDSTRVPRSFAPDEVINYSERTEENETSEQANTESNFHPFDPPPEIPTINPENIGIGNMYSNIVQDLESSLNDVQNIRASNRPGETSDMLSSFSERLESIMNQSDAILRNLRQSMEMLPAASRRQTTTSGDNEQYNFDFYVRENTGRRASNNAIASDHTYPRNPNNVRNDSSSTDNMTPLMTSLHFTISHIQRQARLLRRQVESIERIDRAMLEVAQLQMIRQLFVEMYRHLSSLGESRSAGVSSVRQMMAGTRISDSSPYDSPSDESLNQNQLGNTNNEPEPGPSSSELPGNTAPRSRIINRKTYPPSRLFRMQRQNRRPSLSSLLPRRYVPRCDRLSRRTSHFKTFSNRNLNRSSADLFAGRPYSGRLTVNQGSLNTDALNSMIRRLEILLVDQARVIGQPVLQSTSVPNPTTDLGEHIIILRLNGCRLRMNRVLGRTDNTNINHNYRNEGNCVTYDGVTRYGARHTLSVILDSLSRYFEENVGSSLSQNLQQQIDCILALSLLLSELLLLQIVDSIPPPTGMNLEPERESLTSRIDQMCTHMLQSRLTGQSQQLASSLRIMRMAVRHASLTLNHTFNARRNAILPSQYNSTRNLLMGSLNRCLRTFHRRNETQSSQESNTGNNSNLPVIEWYGTLDELRSRHANNETNRTPPQEPNTSNSSNNNNNLPVIEWYGTLNELISRYSNEMNRLDEEATRSNSSINSSGINAETGEQSQRSTSTSVNNSGSINSDDDTDVDWYNNNSISNSSNQEHNNRPLYRTNNVNLLNNEEPNTSTQNRPWNVPTVHVNDVPISESNPTSQHSTFWTPHYRLSNLSIHPVNFFRPRFLHPLYGGINPFDADRDDPQREQIYDIDMITTVTPNHRIQVWDISSGNIPVINNPLKNVVVSECKIHNDASVDIATDGTILVTLLPSGGYLNVTNRLGVYSLRWETLGQCLYITSFEQNAVSVSLSPLSRHLVVGLASRRVSIVPSDKWTMARIFLLDENESPYGRLPVLRELEQNRDSRASSYKSVNCIRWLPVSGQGLVYATNTGQLIVLT